MPEGFANGLQTQFNYVTVAQVRAQNIPATTIGDADLRGLIRDMSWWVNSLTDQWFLPVSLQHQVDGRRASVAHLPNFVPILELRNLRIGTPNLVTIDMPSMAYVLKPRFVQMLTHRMHLPEMNMFVQLDGVFGWLHDDFRRVVTSTSTAIAVGATSVVLNSVQGIRVGDAVLLGSMPEPLSFAVIIDNVNTGTNTITFEAARFALPAGSQVTRYGIVPPLIQKAVTIMCRDQILAGGNKIGDVDVDEPPFGIGTRLQSESVEGYSYSLAQAPAVAGHAGGSWTTGNPEVDDYLQQYARPTLYLGMV